MRSLALLLMAFGLAGCVDIDFGPSDRYQEDFHYAWDLKPGGRVSVETFNGAVEVAGWDENRVEVTGAKYASSEALRNEIRIETHHDPDVIELRTVRPSIGHGNMGARYTLHVPRTAVVERITSSNGAVRVREVAKAGRLTTSNSSIRAEHFSGGLDARTSNGLIEVESVRGELVLRTSNSRIVADNIEGGCDAGTSNGSIDLGFRSAPLGDVHAHTSNGSITVHLPAGANARLSAETSNSSVRSEFDITDRDDDRKNHLRGVIGKGGPLLEFRTSNGGIHILKSAGE